MVNIASAMVRLKGRARRHMPVCVSVKDVYLTRPYPAWTAIGVTELITPGALLEIRAVAEVPDSPDHKDFPA